MKKVYKSYFEIDEAEVKADFDKLFSLYQKRKDFSDLKLYYASLSKAAYLYSMISGKVPEDFDQVQAIINSAMIPEVVLDVRDLYESLLDENSIWADCFNSFISFYEENGLSSFDVPEKCFFDRKEVIDITTDFFLDLARI